MNNETFGISFQYAVCRYYRLENDIKLHRIDLDLVEYFLNSGIIKSIFRNLSKPIEYLTTSNKFTSPYIRRCPHNFLLRNNKTFSVTTFQSKNKMFAPKVVGQSGDITFNHFFGDLYFEQINRRNFKEFCLAKIDEILPIVVDYALISDYNCWLYLENNQINYDFTPRDNLPDLTYNYSDFTFTKNSVRDWNESNTVKYKGKTILELQLHTNRTGYKIRLHRENFQELIRIEKHINNSMLGDTAELAICNVFGLDPGENERLVNNSDPYILGSFIVHYTENKDVLFPYYPIKYFGTGKRDRGGHSKSGVDFYLDKDHTLSVKTNKSKSYKVCPPEIGQPSPTTFDQYFSTKGWYIPPITENKFKDIIRNKTVVVQLLSEYLKFLNECDYLLWSLYLNGDIESTLINNDELINIEFNPDLIDYSHNDNDKGSVTIKYGVDKISLGEFQVHSARNSLKFRFNFGNLLLMRNI